MPNKFWSFIEGENRELNLRGPISEESWWGDEVTPAAFKEELLSGKGDLTVWINSPGGDVFAAAEIYNQLKSYPGKVTVKIDALAASAATVVAMAGDEVEISPAAMFMIHNPSTFAFGEASDFEKVLSELDAVKQSIINAYRTKTSLSRNHIAELMDSETWMDARKALQLGFVDRIMYGSDEDKPLSDMVQFSEKKVMNSFVNKTQLEAIQEKIPDEKYDVKSLMAELEQLR